MDLIYMNEAREDVGIMRDYTLDMAFGADENNFEAIVPSAAHCCAPGYFLYTEGTEYGGVIDDLGSDTAAEEVTYMGRTWHGILNSKIIEPDPGTAYLILTGEANQIIQQLIDRLSLSELFIASEENSGLFISGYKMNRFIPAYDGIRKMLATVAGKLCFAFHAGKVVLSAMPRGNYTQTSEIDSDMVNFKAVRRYRPVNHLICLGQGELEARQVIHLYKDAAGRINKQQSLFGILERTAVYENTNAESLEELEREGLEQFGKLTQSDEMRVSLNADDTCYDISDLIGAVDNVTGIAVTTEIVKKIVTIKKGDITISYETGG